MIETHEKRAAQAGRDDHRGTPATGMGLAIGRLVKGYKCVFTTTDKPSKEKVDAQGSAPR